MQTKYCILKKLRLGIILTVLTVLALGGCSGDGPAIEARPQTISFEAVPPLSLGNTATVTATASSGLAVSYSSTTPTVCSVNSGTGVVTAIAAGVCTIAANQPGNTQYAPAPQVTQNLPVNFNPNQTINFGSAPTLSLGGIASVSATASSGLPVTYSSTTPTVCSVNGSTGLITDLTAGACTIAANQAGDANYNAAPQATQTITVSVPSGITVPGAPTGVTATAGNTSNTVIVSIGATNSGGSPITGYTVTSTPPGITAAGSASPITVTCPSTCAGYAFSVFASNAIGNSARSALTDVITTYNVIETFYEPDTQPDNSIFTGSFTYDSTNQTVSDLNGLLTEAMTGPPMTTVDLVNQLSSVSNTTLGGLLVTTFALTTTNTFNGGGFAPGGTEYFGFSTGTPNNHNAYAMIFVNTTDPTTALTQAQINKLAYADCTTGGMMGSTCMTGTTVAGYGSIGTMSGYPVSQTITKHQ
jgi:ABC-type Fe3+-hydroxamate transport system substrate-binding protein